MSVDLRRVLGVGARLDTGYPAFFRHRRIGDKVLITNHEGAWLLVTDDEFGRFARGEVVTGTPLHERLRGANLVRAEYDVDKAAGQLRARKAFLQLGPRVHRLIVTHRCNETCTYASCTGPGAAHTDMSNDTAERAIDFILRSTSPRVTLEFRGGEPLLAFDVVKHSIEYALQKNESAGKQISFVLASNLSLLDEEKLGFLLKHRVHFSTFLDGPRALHDRQHRLPGASSYDATTKWIARIDEASAQQGLDPSLHQVEVLLTTTKDTLPLWREVVDTYVELGRNEIFLRPLDMVGSGATLAGNVDCSPGEYLDFYRRALDYVLQLDERGVHIVERIAAIFLTTILAGEDAGDLDLRSPGGAAIGQLVYDHDGKIFTCGEGRSLHEIGDDAFLLGDVQTSTYRAVTGHSTVRALVIASQRDSQPDCVGCTYNPYCGVSPVHSHRTLGSAWGSMRLSPLCTLYKGVQDCLFGKLADGDPHTLGAFQRWTAARRPEHFSRSGGAST